MLPRIAHFFVTVEDIAQAIDLRDGPWQPIHLESGRKLKPLVSDAVIPYIYEPSFLDLVVSVVSPEHNRMEIARRKGSITLYRFPSSFSARLAELTPGRPEFTANTIEEITRNLMQYEQVKGHFLQSGVSTAVLILRGYALKTSSEKCLYYWCKNQS